VVTSFYQSLQAMSSFMRFSICATYCTLSRNDIEDAINFEILKARGIIK
jgi:hypothetical protein